MTSKFNTLCESILNKGANSEVTGDYKTDFKDASELLDWLEEKAPSFIRFALEDKGEKQFFKDFTSGKYDWKFASFSTDKRSNLTVDSYVKTMSKYGWKLYDSTDNVDSGAVILNKIKK